MSFPCFIFQQYLNELEMTGAQFRFKKKPDPLLNPVFENFQQKREVDYNPFISKTDLVSIFMPIVFMEVLTVPPRVKNTPRS